MGAYTRNEMIHHTEFTFLSLACFATYMYSTMVKFFATYQGHFCRYRSLDGHGSRCQWK